MPNLLYVDEQGRPMDHGEATRGLQSGQLTLEQEIEQARQTMEGAKRNLENAQRPANATNALNGEAARQPFNPEGSGKLREYSPSTGSKSIDMDEELRIIENPQAYSDKAIRRTMKDRGGAEWNALQGELDRRVGVKRESMLRSVYDKGKAEHDKRIAEQRAKPVKRSPSGWVIPQDKTLDVPYESFEDYKARVDKGMDKWRKKRDIEELQKENALATIAAKKAETDKKKAETDRLKRPPEPMPPGWERGPDGKAHRKKEKKMTIEDKETLKTLREDKKRALDSLDPDSEAEAKRIQVKIDETVSKYGERTTTEVGAQKGPGITYRWKDEKGVSHSTDRPGQAPGDAELTIEGRTVAEHVSEKMRDFRTRTAPQQAEILEAAKGYLASGRLSEADNAVMQGLVNAMEKRRLKTIYKGPKPKRNLTVSDLGEKKAGQKLTVGDIPGLTQDAVNKIGHTFAGVAKQGIDVTLSGLRTAIREAGILSDFTDEEISKLWEQFKGMELPGQ